MCVLVLVRQQKYVFPEDTVTLAPNEALTVWSGREEGARHDPSNGHLWWTRRYIWNNHGDTAVLVSPTGDVVCVPPCRTCAPSPRHELTVCVFVCGCLHT